MSIDMKKLLFVFAAVLAFAPISVSALNLHNGYIRIFNDTDVTVYVDVRHVVFGHAATFIERIEVPRHGTREINKCCLVAGSEYQIAPEWSEGQYVDGRLVRFMPGAASLGRVTLRLCNDQGVPHGYAYVKTSLVTEGHTPVVHVLRLDETCP